MGTGLTPEAKWGGSAEQRLWISTLLKRRIRREGHSRVPRSQAATPLILGIPNKVRTRMWASQGSRLGRPGFNLGPCTGWCDWVDDFSLGAATRNSLYLFIFTFSPLSFFFFRTSMVPRRHMGNLWEWFCLSQWWGSHRWGHVRYVLRWSSRQRPKSTAPQPSHPPNLPADGPVQEKPTTYFVMIWAENPSLCYVKTQSNFFLLLYTIFRLNFPVVQLAR